MPDSILQFNGAWRSYQKRILDDLDFRRAVQVQEGLQTADMVGMTMGEEHIVHVGKVDAHPGGIDGKKPGGAGVHQDLGGWSL